MKTSVLNIGHESAKLVPQQAQPVHQVICLLDYPRDTRSQNKGRYGTDRRKSTFLPGRDFQQRKETRPTLETPNPSINPQPMDHSIYNSSCMAKGRITSTMS